MASKQYSSPPPMQVETNRIYHATIKTNKGDIHLQLNPAEAPQTVNNFVALARDGFYDGVVFHRVEPRFVIQGGDPTGTGRANPGPHPNGSQFFICLEDPPGLPGLYTIFGDTISGMDVVRNIRPGDVMQ